MVMNFIMKMANGSLVVGSMGSSRMRNISFQIHLMNVLNLLKVGLIMDHMD